MTKIIVSNQNLQNSKKKIRENLDEVVKMKANIFLLERQVKKLSKENPIEAFLQYSKIEQMKQKLFLIESIILLANKLIKEENRN
jgi:hypothetical protein